jgi:citrate lyase beta subunit
MTKSAAGELRKVRSVMETPVLDERKWAKVPQLPTDAVLVDMEDTVAEARKLDGRLAVVGALADLSYFGGRLVLTRPNALDTEWGRADTIALARAGARHVILPMLTCAADVREYQQIFHDNGADPALVAAIETPAAVGHVEEIAAVPGVAALVFGEGDMTAAMGVPIHLVDGSINPVVTHARSRVYLAAAAHDLAQLDVAFTLNLKDLDELRDRAAMMRDMGATGLFALYPPHVAVINDVFTPGEDAVRQAQRIAAAFDRAASDGSPAVQLDGRAILIHDYKKAAGLLARAGLV